MRNKKKNKPYLTEQQLRIVLSYLSNPKNDFCDLFGMIDSFVKDNKTETKQYKSLLSLLKKSEATARDPSFTQDCAQTMRMVYSVLATEYLILVGALSRKELRKGISDLIGGGDDEKKCNMA